METAIRFFLRYLTLVILTATGLSGCGGGGGDSGNPQSPPTTGAVVIDPNSQIESISIGDSDYRLQVLPGEIVERILRVSRKTDGTTFEVSVLEGGDIVSVVEDAGLHRIRVNSTSLAPQAMRAYRLLIRNASTGASARVDGFVQVLVPSTIGSGTIDSDGGGCSFL